MAPSFDVNLPDEFRAGEPKLLRDQRRLLESTMPIENQISELHKTRTLGNLALIDQALAERAAHGLWSIGAHGGND
jgi:hypothetical protein